MRRQLFIGLMLFFIAGFLFAQAPYRDQPSYTTRDYVSKPIHTGLKLSGLLDPSRLSMGHSMGMTYSSFGGRGFTQGYYMNTLTYQFSAPVVLRTRLGVTNNPFESSAPSAPGTAPYEGLMQNAEFFGGVDLDWRPKENVFLRFSVDRAPPSIYNYGPWSWNKYYNPWMYPSLMDRRRPTDPGYSEPR